MKTLAGFYCMHRVYRTLGYTVRTIKSG